VSERCNAQLEVTDGVGEACRLVAKSCHGRRGTFAYECFDHINGTFFGGMLPTPLLVWELSEYGRCLGATGLSETKTPVVLLHPSLLGSNREQPWSIPRELLGVTYAYDVLLHECMHIYLHHILGWREGPGETSHNNDRWVDEVNRIAPMIGLDIVAARSKTKRIPVEGQITKTGKPATRVVRVSAGTVPFADVAAFPNAVREHLKQVDWYREHCLPFPHALDRMNRNSQLAVTPHDPIGGES